MLELDTSTQETHVPVGCSEWVVKILSCQGNKTFKTDAHIKLETQELCILDWQASGLYFRCFKDLLIARGFLDQGLIFFSDGAQFTLYGSVNSQNNRYQCSESRHEVPLYDLEV